MKAFLAIFGGFVVALGMFVGGLALAAVVLTAEPARQAEPTAGIADVWTGKPRVVDVKAQDFERVAAIQPTVEQGAATQAAANGTTAESERPSVDAVTTASVRLPAEESEPASQFSDAHMAWCSSRYRSYRASDNSYRPYSGGRRTCTSPFSEEGVSAPLSSPEDEFADYEEASSPVLLQYAADGMESRVDLPADHVSYCFSRYRSYRPSDNTYQPYGGGPRRECL
ncbi:BA14K family protein [Arvimicrobium flavum]|uniref:BA14K family protein n=1 Tax=Arvimicrobium flavum TaxID=3393320 RepID=UPI00237C2D63|nr:BA14K family protein [Mesorhizobium shangrilense]